jgi:hypothetical protein
LSVARNVEQLEGKNAEPACGGEERRKLVAAGLSFLNHKGTKNTEASKGYRKYYFLTVGEKPQVSVKSVA